MSKAHSCYYATNVNIGASTSWVSNLWLLYFATEVTWRSKRVYWSLIVHWPFASCCTSWLRWPNASKGVPIVHWPIFTYPTSNLIILLLPLFNVTSLHSGRQVKILKICERLNVLVVRKPEYVILWKGDARVLKYLVFYFCNPRRQITLGHYPAHHPLACWIHALFHIPSPQSLLVWVITDHITSRNTSAHSTLNEWGRGVRKRHFWREIYPMAQNCTKIARVSQSIF